MFVNLCCFYAELVLKGDIVMNLMMQFSRVTFCRLVPDIVLNALFSNTPMYTLWRETKFHTHAKLKGLHRLVSAAGLWTACRLDVFQDKTNSPFIPLHLHFWSVAEVKEPATAYEQLFMTRWPRT
jgi:hypothetical protein